MFATKYEVVWVACHRNIIRTKKSTKEIQWAKTETSDIINCLTTYNDERSNYQVWTGCNDGNLMLWDFRVGDGGGEILCQLVDNNRVSGLQIVDDQLWSCGWDNFLRVWSLQNHTLLQQIPTPHRDMICSLLLVAQNHIWLASWDKSISI